MVRLSPIPSCQKHSRRDVLRTGVISDVVGQNSSSMRSVTSESVGKREQKQQIDGNGEFTNWLLGASWPSVGEMAIYRQVRRLPFSHRVHCVSPAYTFQALGDLSNPR